MYLEAIMFSSVEYLRAIQKADEFDYNSTLQERTLRYPDETYNFRTCLHKFKGYCDHFIDAHKLYHYPNGDVGGLGEVYLEAYDVDLKNYKIMRIEYRKYRNNYRDLILSFNNRRHCLLYTSPSPRD